MSRVASAARRWSPGREMAIALGGCLLLPASAIAQGAEPISGIPDFAGYFAHNTSVYQPSAHVGPGPVMDHPEHPHVVIADGITSPWVGDYANPMLKPWVAAEVRKNAETELSGGFFLVAYQLCFPLGVPLILTQRNNVQLLQEQDLVTLLYQRDQQVRRVYLNRAHSEDVMPSWYGESVGHYEGDTLVVDTIGLDTRSVVDRYGSPHTEALHVVERYRLVDEGQSMQVEFSVEDPGAFNTAWSGAQKYRRTSGPMEEIYCSENNRNVETDGEYDIPVALRADF